MICFGPKPAKNQGKPSAEDGNVLVFILIAIALLGALSMTFMRSQQGTSDTASYERTSIKVSQMMKYAASLENAVKLLRSRGCSENELSFWHDSDGNSTEDGSDDYYNAGAPSDHSCHIFEPEGAGLTWQTPDSSWLDSSESGGLYYGEWTFQNRTCIPDVGTGDNNCWSAPSSMDLIAVLSWIDLDVCLQINRRAGMPNNGSEPYGEAGAALMGTFFKGSFSQTGHNLQSSGGDFAGVKTACFKGAGADPAGGYHFYHVLLAR
jgi:type II secretory pathway pseudopilin PulG